MSTDKQKEPASTCSQCETAAAYVRNELSGTVADAFATHMRKCPDCAAVVEGFTEVLRKLEDRPPLPDAPDLVEAVLARIPESEWEGKAQSREARPMVIAWPLFRRVAALFVVLLCGIGIVRFLTREPPPTPRMQAMDEASAWLAASQERSGAWSPEKWQGRSEFEISLTGMALLTLLGLNPDQAETGPYAENIERAVVYLVAQQRENGNFGPETDGVMYNHGIATVAMLEALVATDDEALIEPVGRALKFIRDRQLDSGGWGYIRDDSGSANTSISVWQLQALARAKQLGMWRDIVPSFHKGLLWLQGMVGKNGLVGYRRPNDFPEESETLTAMAATCLLSAGSRLQGLEDTNSRVRSALKAVASNPGQATDFYHAYFLASALSAGGEEFDPALARIQGTLVAQRVTSGANAGSWDTVDNWSSVGGRIYTTSMAALSLRAGP